MLLLPRKKRFVTFSHQQVLPRGYDIPFYFGELATSAGLLYYHINAQLNETRIKNQVILILLALCRSAEFFENIITFHT
jgi:hypothetical protein